jgi:Uma2 family endonuclease
MHDSPHHGVPPARRRVGPEEAERISASSDRYFEYAHGILYAMAGGTPEHGAVLAQLFTAVSSHVGRGPCRTLEGHTRLYVSAQDYYLPDVWVTCAERPAPGQPGDYDATLVCEVISTESEDRDHDTKLVDYRALPSLREYVLLDSRRQRAHRYLLVGDTWQHTIVLPHGTLHLTSVGLELPLDTLYADTGVPVEQETAT